MKSFKKTVAVLMIFLLIAAVFPVTPLSNGVFSSGPVLADSEGPTEAEDTDLNKYIKGAGADKVSTGATLSFTVSQASIIYKYYATDPNAYLQFRVYPNTDRTGVKYSSAKYFRDSAEANFKIPEGLEGMYLYLYLVSGDNNLLYSSPVEIVPVIHIISGPEFKQIYKAEKVLSVDIDAYITTHEFKYYTTDENNPKTVTSPKLTIRLYRNGKEIRKSAIDADSVSFNKVPVSYGKNDTFKLTIASDVFGTEFETSGNSFGASSKKLAANKPRATCINANKAVIRWPEVKGATGYRIYQGSKKIKTVKASVKKIAIKKKKIGKSKIKVVPYVTFEGNTVAGSSKTVKPKANAIKLSGAIKHSSHPYRTCKFVIKKISLKGSTYTITGYAANNRIFKMKKYKKLKVAATVEGKKAFSKTFKNVTVNAKPSSSKKIVLKVKGKAGIDLANCSSITVTVAEKPGWTI